jgi:hypothetical protein
MSASIQAFLTTREAKTGKTGNSSSQANKPKLSPPITSPIDQISYLQRTVGNRGVEQLLKSGVVQAKLKVNEPGDIYEQEADRTAGQVLATPTPAPIGGTASRIQRVARQPADETTSAPASVERALASPGQPFEPGLRQEMEHRFGHNFSRVRVHLGAAAERSARDVNARAYTVGDNLVFGAGEFKPETPQGRRLLAHELTHVVQQQTTGRVALARQPAQPAQIAPPATRQFETNIAVLDPTKMEEWRHVSFWLDRVGRLFQISISAEAAERFKDEEERDAVLAALWRIRPDPGKLVSDEVEYVRIPALARAQMKRPAEVLYRFVFSPKAGDQAKGAVAIHFETEHPTGVVTYASIPPAGHERQPSKLAKQIGEGLTQLQYHHEGFPQGDAVGYWEQHPEEEKQLFHWVERQGRSFMQIVITRTAEQRGKVASIREKPFMVKGSKDNQGRINDLSIELVGKGFHLTETWLSPDYHSRDGADMLLEQIQEQPDPIRKDRLGKVTLGKVPQEEAFPLKYTIWGYFRMGTRDAEVDTIVAVPGTKRRIFYTLRFRQNNDVDVERIGEEGAEAKLDPSRLDIALVKGYESNAADPNKLKSWLRKRYPRIKAEGETPVEVRESANKSLEAETGKPDWFKENYQIHILAAEESKKWLENLGWKKKQLDNLKNFTAEELKLAEISLQPLSENVLHQLEQTRLVRQTAHIIFNAKDRTFDLRPNTQGFTVSVGKKSTVLIFDAMKAPVRFLGGATGVRPGDVMTFTHELGHVVGFKAGAAAVFNKFVKDEGIQPFTPYAIRDPESEFFAEAFYLYHTDPEWLKSSHPKVFDWFEALSKNSGKKPLKSK